MKGQAFLRLEEGLYLVRGTVEVLSLGVCVFEVIAGQLLLLENLGRAVRSNQRRKGKKMQAFDVEGRLRFVQDTREDLVSVVHVCGGILYRVVPSEGLCGHSSEAKSENTERED